MAKPALSELLIEIMRLHRPIGIWLLMLPCWFGLAYVSPGFPDPWYLMLFALGATVMRGAGCIYNDIVDRNLDAQVERTKTRPIARGDLTIPHAIIFIIILTMIGGIILYQFPSKAILIGVFSVTLLLSYPWMKRITYWPQAFLGITFNWGIWVAWGTQDQSLSLGILCLYLGSVLWTIGYDTIYAHQDREDDLLVGMKSSAIKFGEKTKSILWLLYGGATLLWLIAGNMANLRKWFYGGMISIAIHFAWQIVTLNINDGQNCAQRFLSNSHVGLILFIAIVLGRILN